MSKWDELSSFMDHEFGRAYWLFSRKQLEYVKKTISDLQEQGCPEPSRFYIDDIYGYHYRLEVEWDNLKKRAEINAEGDVVIILFFDNERCVDGKLEIIRDQE